MTWSHQHLGSITGRCSEIEPNQHCAGYQQQAYSYDGKEAFMSLVSFNPGGFKTF